MGFWNGRVTFTRYRVSGASPKPFGQEIPEQAEKHRIGLHTLRRTRPTASPRVGPAAITCSTRASTWARISSDDALSSGHPHRHRQDPGALLARPILRSRPDGESPVEPQRHRDRPASGRKPRRPPSSGPKPRPPDDGRFRRPQSLPDSLGWTMRTRSMPAAPARRSSIGSKPCSAETFDRSLEPITWPAASPRGLTPGDPRSRVA